MGYVFISVRAHDFDNGWSCRLDELTGCRGSLQCSIKGKMRFTFVSIFKTRLDGRKGCRHDASIDEDVYSVCRVWLGENALLFAIQLLYTIQMADTVAEILFWQMTTSARYYRGERDLGRDTCSPVSRGRLSFSRSLQVRLLLVAQMLPRVPPALISLHLS